MIDLDQIVIEHIHSTMFNHIHPRKLHNLSNLCFIITMVTLGFTFLAHRFGIVGALQPHGQTIS